MVLSWSFRGASMAFVRLLWHKNGASMELWWDVYGDSVGLSWGFRGAST